MPMNSSDQYYLEGERVPWEKDDESKANFYLVKRRLYFELGCSVVAVSILAASFQRDLYFLKCWEQAFGVLHCPYPVPSRVRSPSTNGNYMSPLRCIIKDQRWSILEISNLIFNHICKCKIMFVVSFVIKKYTRLCMKGLEWEW